MTSRGVITRPSGQPLAAVLFDMDGLLIDSEPVWSIAEAELAAQHGGRWDEELKTAIIGTSITTAVPIMLRSFGLTPTQADVDETMAWLLGRMVTLFATELPLQPGALELVDALRAEGVPLALVSSSYRVLVDAALQVIGPERFDFTLAGDEVSRTKPDPEPYLVAAASLGVAPQDCVVFEDAPSGITAAEAAGCLAIGVTGHAPLQPTDQRPIFASLAEVDLDWLLSLPLALRRAS
jgi:HAD superfamily hydrolase (TIGR01509 family)